MISQLRLATGSGPTNGAGLHGSHTAYQGRTLLAFRVPEFNGAGLHMSGTACHGRRRSAVQLRKVNGTGLQGPHKDYVRWQLLALWDKVEESGLHEPYAAVKHRRLLSFLSASI